VVNENNSNVMADSHPENPAPRPGDPLAEVPAGSDFRHTGVGDLFWLARKLPIDRNLEVSEIGPFFWTMVEVYVDRFQLFPFDAVRALFSYLEFHDYPEEQLRDLIKQLQQLYEEQHGRSDRESAHVTADNVMLDDEIKELRETLKYAAIAGERIENYE